MACAEQASLNMVTSLEGRKSLRNTKIGNSMAPETGSTRHQSMHESHATAAAAVEAFADASRGNVRRAPTVKAHQWSWADTASNVVIGVPLRTTRWCSKETAVSAMIQACRLWSSMFPLHSRQAYLRETWHSSQA
jgi:hypothetical protein